MAASIEQLDADIKAVKKALRAAGVHENLVTGISTRALRTARKTTGKEKTNRECRWMISDTHSQYAPEPECKAMLLRLYAMLMEFEGAPQLPAETVKTLEQHLGRSLRPNSYRDPLTLETMSYAEVSAAAAAPKHGESGLHMGH